jgi:hypothetical protein
MKLSWAKRLTLLVLVLQQREVQEKVVRWHISLEDNFRILRKVILNFVSLVCWPLRFTLKLHCKTPQTNNRFHNKRFNQLFSHVSLKGMVTW